MKPFTSSPESLAALDTGINLGLRLLVPPPALKISEWPRGLKEREQFRHVLDRDARQLCHDLSAINAKPVTDLQPEVVE